MTDARACEACGRPGACYVVRWSETLPARALEPSSGAVTYFVSGGVVAEVSLLDGEQYVAMWNRLLLCMGCYTSTPLDELACAARLRREAVE